MKNASAGRRRDGSLPIFENAQSIRFVHPTRQRFVKVAWIGAILVEENLFYIGWGGSVLRLKGGVSRVELPRHKVVGEEPLLRTSDGSLND